MHNWRFWVITGIDYSGKTTILRAIGRRGIPSLHWSDLRDVSWINPILERPYEIVFEMGPMTRASFLLLVASTMYEYALKNNIKLIDSYWYRFYVKEKLFGLSDLTILETLFKLPKPEAVFYVNITPEEALKRSRGNYTPYETYGKDPIEFLRFQRDLDKELSKLLENLDLNIIYLDGSRKINELVNQLLRIIR